MFKHSNIGNADRIARIVVGVILLAAPFAVTSTLWVNPLMRWGFVVVGAILVLTALIRFCPLYRIIGASTDKASVRESVSSKTATHKTT